MLVQIDGEWTYHYELTDDLRLGMYVRCPGKIKNTHFVGQVTAIDVQTSYTGPIKYIFELAPEIQTFEDALAYNTIQKMRDKVVASTCSENAIRHITKSFVHHVMGWSMDETYKFRVARRLVEIGNTMLCVVRRRAA